VELVDFLEPAAHRVHLGAQLVDLGLERAQLARGVAVGSATAQPARERAADGRERKPDRAGDEKEEDRDEKFWTANSERSGGSGPFTTAWRRPKFR
jgi:hypothetical protein